MFYASNAEGLTREILAEHQMQKLMLVSSQVVESKRGWWAAKLQVALCDYKDVQDQEFLVWAKSCPWIKNK